MCVCVCIYIDNLGHIMAHHHDDNIDVNVVVVISKAMDPARKPPLCVCVWKRFSKVSDPRHLLNKSHYRERVRLRVPSGRGQTLGTR